MERRGTGGGSTTTQETLPRCFSSFHPQNGKEPGVYQGCFQTETFERAGVREQH